MSFLAPLWLALGLAAAVPLLLHLMRRKVGTRLDFPAVRWLLRAERESSRALRLRNLLLMLLRVAIVLLIAVAAARPLAAGLGGEHGPTAVAIVLDNSLSTTVVEEGAPRLETLRRAAREVATAATLADRLWLVTADGAVTGGTRERVLEAIGLVRPIGGAGDVPGAVTRAAALARAAGLPAASVAVATDAQASSWAAVADARGAGVSVLAPGGAPPANRAVVRATPAPPRWTPRGTLAVRARGGDSLEFRVELSGRTLARGTAPADREVIVQAAPAERGWLAGAVSLEADELRGDDRRWFAVWTGAAPRVAVDPDVGPFVRQAVEALVQEGRVTGGAGIAVAPADRASRRPALLVAPRDPVRIGAANRALERLGVRWRFGALRRGESPVRAVGERWSGVSTTLRWTLEPTGPAEDADTLALAGGEPWIVAVPGVVIVASPLEVEATTFPVSAPFAPWLATTLSQRLATDGGGVVIERAPGAAVRLPAGTDALLHPDGRSVPVSTRLVSAPAEAGVYFLRSGSERTGALVVNAEGEESVLERLGADRLRERVRGDEVRVSDDAAGFARGAFDRSSRRALTGALLLAALLALLAETVVVARRRAA